MLAKLLLPDLAGLELITITVDQQTIVLEVRLVTSQAACPTCGVVSDRIHSRYTRHPRDLAWAGGSPADSPAVRLVLAVTTVWLIRAERERD